MISTAVENLTPSIDRLYHLLPQVHRQRDEQLGWPLRDLLRESKQLNSLF